MPRAQFAWVYQPSPRKGSSGASLLADNERFIERLRPHIHAVWVEDHFQWGAEPVVECWTTLAYLAGKYPGLTLAPLVLGQSYRNPALTAKMASTLYWLTGGRMLFGIGAGWKEDEYRAYGYGYPPARARIEELDEALTIIKMLWAQSPASFQGRHYSIDRAYCEPRPAPPPPIMVGGSGERYLLGVVARHADWWNAPFLTPDEFRRKLAVLDRRCIEAGRDPATLRKTYFGFCSISRDPAKLVRREGMHVIAGPSEQVAAELDGFVQAGVDYFILRFLDFPALDGVEMFLDKVLPHFV